MAECLGISQSNYGNIEWDEVEITIKRLANIAIILEVPLSNLLDFDEKNIFEKVKHNETERINDLQKHIDFLQVFIEKLIKPPNTQTHEKD